MVQDTKNKNHYLAEENKIIIAKDDVFDAETQTYKSATKSIWLGKFDDIENYKEVEQIE